MSLGSGATARAEGDKSAGKSWDPAPCSLSCAPERKTLPSALLTVGWSRAQVLGSDRPDPRSGSQLLHLTAA